VIAVHTAADAQPPLCVQPDETGLAMARALDNMGVPVTMVLDSGAAYCMERCGHARVGSPPRI
jgi:translation initiation factor 2B subunit (eIF-2B alpha/beta/delta family)